MAVLDSAVHFTPSSPDPTGGDLVSAVVRAQGKVVSTQTVAAAVQEYLQQAPQATRCALNVVESGAIDVALTAMTGKAGKGLGWEATLFPESDPGPHQRSRATRALPKGCSLVRGTSRASLDHLQALHRLSADYLSRVHLNHDDSFLLLVEGDVRGWIPVERFNATTVTFRAVLHDAELFSDEPRRRSFLRLTAWSQAASTHASEGSTIITWMPDDGDPINEYKLKVARPDWLVHWVTHIIEPAALTPGR
jgi:hypothetical protein